MKIFVKVKPGAKVEKIDQEDADHFFVWVKEPPVEGRANKAVIAALADYFGVPQSQVRILSGAQSRNKVIEIVGRTYGRG